MAADYRTFRRAGRWRIFNTPFTASNESVDHLTALRVFREVVQQNGFAAAGRKLGLSSPAVSKNVNELEAHLSTRLLNRTTRRLSLTEAGVRYYAQIAQILDDLDETERSLNPAQQSPGGTLRVSAPVTMTLLMLSEAIPAFLERYPNLKLDLNLDDRRVDLVHEGYDVAIRGSDRLLDSSLVARRLTSLPHVICGSPDYFARRGQPAAPEDLHAHECLQFTLSGHANEWTFRKDGEERRIPVDGRYKASSCLAVRDALRAGFGLTMIPCAYVKDDLARGTLTTALDDWEIAETGVYAVYPSRRHLDPKVRVFVDFLVEAMR